jgi:bacterioferritin-associated ferredoxin
MCTGATSEEIRDAVVDGARTVEEVSEALGGVGTICEICREVVVEIISEVSSEADRPSP